MPTPTHSFVSLVPPIPNPLHRPQIIVSCGCNVCPCVKASAMVPVAVEAPAAAATSVVASRELKDEMDKVTVGDNKATKDKCGCTICPCGL